ncbi:MAG: hypothetical protein FWG28_04915 [Clostridiales bacterium]|nr:hypothetical protein [Clostridiales bacterium]
MAEVIEKTAFIDDRAEAAKLSDEGMELLIEDFKPFLRSRVSKYAIKGSPDQQEDMFSTAMIAFYEAVRGYEKEKGHFFPFANRVVCERLIDHVRGIYRQSGRTVPLEEEDEEQKPASSSAIVELSIRTYEIKRKQEQLADEIEQFKSELTTWGITMETLSKQSPKHQKVRDSYRMVVSAIAQTPDIVQTIQLKRYFPIKAISEITGLPQKKLERARIFILASLIIKMGDYDYLSEYVS